MDEKFFSCSIFINLRKADHNILHYKLHHYGIGGIVNKWSCSYLTGRFETTQIETKISKKETTACGLPQGSFLGPPLFLLYINDISASSSKFEFFPLANDTNLLCKDKSLSLLESVVNEELTTVCDQLLANKLTLNTKKSNYKIFNPYQRRTSSAINLKVFHNEHKAFRNLERKQFVKFLGVLMDSNLLWSDHVSNVALKVSKTIGIIAKLRHVLPTSVFLNIFNSFIHPHLSYGLVVWGQTSKTNLKKNLIHQKRALCLIYFSRTNPSQGLELESGTKSPSI